MTSIIQNKVAALCKDRGLDRDSFIGLCLQSKVVIKGQRLKADVAGRVFDGDTNLTLRSAALVAKALDVKLSDIFEIK